MHFTSLCVSYVLSGSFILLVVKRQPWFEVQKASNEKKKEKKYLKYKTLLQSFKAALIPRFWTPPNISAVQIFRLWERFVENGFCATKIIPA